MADSTVREALTAATDSFEAAGIDSARLDAELLLADALEVGREKLASDPDMAVSGAAARKFGENVRRRNQREPVAYILGQSHFRNLALYVNDDVLIPRPETELLVELAGAGEKVLDVGTGSGAIALAVADENEGVEVVGTDTSQAALKVARKNAEALGLAVDFVQADLISGSGYDLILSNPPYVKQSEWLNLQPEITKFEPNIALIAGEDGLAVIRRLIRAVPATLKPGGRLAIEVGQGQADEVATLMQEAGFESPHKVNDYARIERVVWAQFN